MTPLYAFLAGITVALALTATSLLLFWRWMLRPEHIESLVGGMLDGLRGSGIERLMVRDEEGRLCAVPVGAFRAAFLNARRSERTTEPDLPTSTLQ